MTSLIRRWFFTLLAVTLFLAASPAFVQAGQPVTARLDNGLEVVVQSLDRAPVAAVQVWSWVLSPERYGLANTVLISLGLKPLQWFYHPNTALASIAILGLWTNIGLNMLIFLAAIKNIPAQLYESATVDGAGPWSQFWYITIPQLMPTIYFVVITSTILALKIFRPILLLTGGGPLNSTTTVAYQIYEQAFQFTRWGRASAQATLFFVIVLAITIIQYRFLPESYDK